MLRSTALLSLSACVLAACGSDGLVANELSPASAAGELAWVGDTQLRYDGYRIPNAQVMSGRALEVYAQTYPMGAATEVRLFWSDPAQTNIRSRAMVFDADHTGPFGNNTQWRTEIPSADLSPDQQLDYWVRAQDGSGRVLWDSRDGANYSLVPRTEVELFDGDNTDCWRMAGPGEFSKQEGALHSHPRDGLGVYWCAYPTPPDFELSLEWSMTAADDNSGVFIRFPDPDLRGYQNPGWVAVHYGFEIQIDEIARPDGADIHRTGAIYGEVAQRYTGQPARPPGEWNRYLIRAEGQRYTVSLEGRQVTSFDFAGDPNQPERALPSAPGAPRFIGLQSHSGTVRFRNVSIRSH